MSRFIISNRPSAVASTLRRCATIVVAGALLAACNDDDYITEPTPTPPPPAANVQVTTASGAIADPVTTFRTLLGDPANGGTPGAQPAGRREVSWDGAGAKPFNNRNDFPGDFFNVNVKSGAVFSTLGTGFRNDSLAFSEIDASYAQIFAPFSPPVSFSAVGSPIITLDFKVPGEAAAARVRGVGVVFLDVDRAGSTTVEAFDGNGTSLGTVSAPVRTAASNASFVGLYFPGTTVARIRIRAGDAALAPGLKDIKFGGNADLVVIDNIIFSEPVVP